ncbi:hypothetical protein C2S53_004560 [Perilla frutescens var. hirtella]|uniref:Uncharacterized protein n=1 Tax=Perilla frutescens var. hirtella TaxID=608512 RepID=A0AAD4JLE1_PERFH|nr:hypothetical protein C2S53_004560 [Perilla frutescens var. hirtella]
MGSQVQKLVMPRRKSLVEIPGGPRPDLSHRIRQICQEMSQEGIVSKLWPNVRYIKCVSTWSMASII